MRQASWHRYLWCVPLCVVAVATQPAGAQEPTRVGVFVRIDDPDTRRVCQAVVAPFERDAAMLVGERLGERIGFVRFAANDSSQPYRLTLSLDRRDRNSTRPLQEIGIWARLDRPGLAEVVRYWPLVIRAADQFSQPRCDQALLNTLDDRLRRDDLSVPRDSLMRRVPITGTADAVLQPALGWMLPFGPRHLCMALQSELDVTNEITNRQHILRARVTSDHGNRLFSEPFGPPPSPLTLQELEHAVRKRVVRVTAVYVLTYERTAGQCGTARLHPLGGAGGAS